MFAEYCIFRRWKSGRNWRVCTQHPEMPSFYLCPTASSLPGRTSSFPFPLDTKDLGQNNVDLMQSDVLIRSRCTSSFTFLPWRRVIWFGRAFSEFGFQINFLEGPLASQTLSSGNNELSEVLLLILTFRFRQLSGLSKKTNWKFPVLLELLSFEKTGRLHADLSFCFDACKICR